MDAWPFLGVSILLLIIFMVNPGPSHQSTILDLPLTRSAATQPKAIREDAMRVTIMRDGTIFFRNAKIAPEELPDLIRKAVEAGAERKVYLVVDARAKYADVEAVIDQIRKTGIHEVTFLTEKIAPH